MPASPATRCSPGREPRSDKHKRGRSLESGILFKERDDDLALFNEVQSRERDTFLLQPNDDFEDSFMTKLRHFSDHKLGVNIPARGESSDLLNVDEEKNDYEWLITPPDTPLFPSLDDEAPHVILAQRGRTRTQPISISRSSTMEKSHRSGRGSASPNRLSPSPRSSNTVFQPRGRASSAPSSSPPATLRPTTASRRLSPPSSKPSTPTPRRSSTGSTVKPVNTSRGNSASPKVKAWQANIPGFSTEAPPNLRTSLADRPASYVRGSSPASRNGGHSKSPTPSRSVGSPHSHDRDRFSSRSKGSIASSCDDDVESLPSIVVGSLEQSGLRKVGGVRNNKAPFSQKPSRTVSSSSAPKRSFDLALRQMDHKKVPQNMFRPLLSSVPSTTFYAGKASPAWNSSVTTSSNASSDLGTSGAHDIDGIELNQDDATSEGLKVPESDVDDEVFIFEKTDSLNKDTANEAHGFEGDPVLHSPPDGLENLADREVTDDNLKEFDSENDTVVCSKCGSRYSIIEPTEDDVKLCENCRKLYSPSTIDENQESFNTTEPQMAITESPETTWEGETRSMQHEELVNADETEPSQVSHEVTDQQSQSYSDNANDQIQHTINVPKPKIEPLEGKGISILLKRSSSVKGPVIRTGNFSYSSISYDDLSYARGSTNSVRSVSVSSSVDFGQSMQTDTRFHRQLSSRKSDVDNINNHKHRRSVSSLSGTSSRAFHPSNPDENDPENEDVNNVQVDIASTEELLRESLNIEEPDSIHDDTGALTTCTVEEGISVDSADVMEVALGAISEGELDHACSSSAASQCDVPEGSESSVEESVEASVPIALDKAIAVSATDCDASNHSSGIIAEESTVLIESREGTKRRSLTLEEATDTILFCSSIVHNLAYESATIAIDKETPLENPFDHNASLPLFPAVGNNKNEPQNKNTSKRRSKSQKTKQKKRVETDTVKASNGANTDEETDVPSKPRIVYPNNKENTRPPKLESKCNCTIM